MALQGMQISTEQIAPMRHSEGSPKSLFSAPPSPPHWNYQVSTERTPRSAVLRAQAAPF